MIKLQLIKEGKKKVDIEVGDYFTPEDKLFFWGSETTEEYNWKRAKQKNKKKTVKGWNRCRFVALEELRGRFTMKVRSM